MNQKRILNLAIEQTKKDSSLVYNFGRFLFPKGELPIFCLCYAYFRWLDDVVDAPNVSIESVQAILNKQVKIFQQSSNSNYVIDCWNDYENMLMIILEHDKRGNCYLQRHVLEMLSALQFDSKRRHQIRSKDELDLYSTLLGRAYTNFILSFISRSVNGKDSAVHLAGYAAHKAHILRDFYQDISLGYYNIGNEELWKHGYLKDQLLSADLRPWVFDVVQESYEKFKCGLKGIMRLGDLRCRFIGLLISVQYLYVLERIKCNDYVLDRIAIEPNTQEKRYMFRWALRETFLRFNDINTIDTRTLFLLQS